MPVLFIIGIKKRSEIKYNYQNYVAKKKKKKQFYHS